MAEGRPTSMTLLDRARAADADAWRRLTFLYEPLVRYWGGRWGVAGADADDLVQEVFAAAAAGLAGFRRDRPGDTFRGWLRGVTRFKALDVRRGRARRPAAAGGTEARVFLEGIADPAAEDDDPPEEAGALYRRAVQLVRGEFEAATWEMFWRSAIDGHPVALIAAEAGVSEAAVRKAKSRVLRRLKEEVGDVAD